MSLGLSDIQNSACAIIVAPDRGRGAELVDQYIARFGNDAAFQFASVNQIAGMIGHYVRSMPERSRWRSAHQETEVRLTAYLNELDRVAALLAKSNIPLVALKNGGIARGIYLCRGCCPMGDIDVLVRKSDFRGAHQLMLAAGYQFEFRSPLEEAELEAAEQGGGAEYWKMLPNGEKLWFELQWRPVAGRWLRPDQEPIAEELVERSHSIPGTVVRLLSPEDNLLQVSLHTAKHTYVRAPGFRLHLDVERIVRYQEVNWEIFVERVVRLQVKTPVYFSLVLPKLFFETPIPEYVLSSLRPSRWKEKLILRWLHRAGFFSPDEKKFGKVGYIVFNSLLYDDLNGLLRGVFPGKSWMRETYGIEHDFLLPFYYLKRLGNLIFKRSST